MLVLVLVLMLVLVLVVQRDDWGGGGTAFPVGVAEGSLPFIAPSTCPLLWCVCHLRDHAVCFVSQVFQNSVFGHDTGFHPTDVAFDPLISELQRAAQ